MTISNNDKLKDIVEAAGECWHEFKIDHWQHDCIKCGFNGYGPNINNPSPTDLNELFRLAEKLAVKMGHQTGDIDLWSVHLHNRECIIGDRFFTADFFRAHQEGFKYTGDGDTPAEALLNALTEAIRR